MSFDPQLLPPGIEVNPMSYDPYYGYGTEKVKPAMEACLKPEELSAIRQRAERATPGPWIKCGGYTPNYIGICDRERERLIVESMGEWNTMGPMTEAQMDQQHDNARFIAHARDDIPALLAHIEQLEAQLKATP